MINDGVFFRVDSYLRKLLIFLVIFGLLSAIALPMIPLPGISLYGVTIFSFFIFFVIFSLWSIHPVFNLSALLPLFMGCMVLFSASFSWLIELSSPISGDILESIKYIQFFPYLLTLSYLPFSSVKVIKKCVFLSAIFVILAAFLQIFQVPYISDLLLLSYLGSDSAHFEHAISGYRITLTGSNPNVGAVIAMFFMFFFLSNFIVNKKKSSLLLSFVFLSLIFFTQSRTVVLASIFSFSIYFFFYFKFNFLIKFISFLLFIVVVVCFVLFFDMKYIYIGFQQALEGKNSSLNIRIENIAMAIDRFQTSPLTGVGPAKSEFTTVIDSEYALIIQRYGFSGVLIFGVYIVYLLKLARRNLDNEWGVTLFLFMVASCVIMATNNIFSGYQLMSVVVLLHIACVLEKRKKLLLKGSCHVRSLPSNVCSPQV